MKDPSGRVSVRWLGGGEAHIVSLDKDAITLRSTVPSPPGSRLEGVVGATEGPGEVAARRPPATAPISSRAVTLRIKVHSSRLSALGDFVLTGRPIDLPRSVRDALARQLPKRAQGV